MLSCFSCDPTYCSLPGSCDHEILQTRILGVDCCFLLHGIFPTQGSNPQSLTSSVLAGGFFTACTTWEVWTTVSVLVYTSQHLFSTILVVSFQHFFFFFELINSLSPLKWGLLTSAVFCKGPSSFSGVILNNCFCFVLFYDKRSHLGPVMLISSRL